MALTKTYAALLTGVTTTQNSSASTAPNVCYAACVYAKLVVVGTPTVSAAFYVGQSPDQSTYYNSATYSAPLAAATYYWTIPLDPTCESIIIYFTQATGGTSSTFTAQLGEVTGV